MGGESAALSRWPCGAPVLLPPGSAYRVLPIRLRPPSFRLYHCPDSPVLQCVGSQDLVTMPGIIVPDDAPLGQPANNSISAPCFQILKKRASARNRPAVWLYQAIWREKGSAFAISGADCAPIRIPWKGSPAPPAGTERPGGMAAKALPRPGQ